MKRTLSMFAASAIVALTAKKGSGAIILMVADGEQITMKGSVEMQGEAGRTWLDFKTDITGSPTTDLYREKEQYRNELNAKLAELFGE